MTKIETKKGDIEILKPTSHIIAQLQNLLPFGVMPFNTTFESADYGIVMHCGNQEIFCIKQQPLEIEKEDAHTLFQLQHFMIVQAYTKYLKLQIPGAYLAAPYLRQRDNGLWEAGVAHFLFPAHTTIVDESPPRKAFDNRFGIGATDMLSAFVQCYKQSFAETSISMPNYFGTDLRPRSHLKNLGMYFMVLHSHVICLRPHLREKQDNAWPILAGAGIDKVFHMPSLPMTIKDDDIDKAKGKI